jgi:cytochrome c
MKSKFFVVAMVLAVTTPLAIGSALASGDAKRGKKVFNKCKACHSLTAGKRKIGPDLANLFGRKAASVKGYRYSPAMKKSGIVWNEETLEKFLTKPRKFLPGTKMTFAGLKKKKQRDDLISYLEQATK